MVGIELTQAERSALYGTNLIISQALFDQIDFQRNRFKLHDESSIAIISESLIVLYGIEKFNGMTLEEATNVKGKSSTRFNFGDLVNPFDIISQLEPNIGAKTYQIHKETNIPHARSIVTPLFDGPHALDFRPENLARADLTLRKRLSAFRREATLDWQALQAKFPLVELVHPGNNQPSYPRIVTSS